MKDKELKTVTLPHSPPARPSPWPWLRWVLLGVAGVALLVTVIQFEALTIKSFKKAPQSLLAGPAQAQSPLAASSPSTTPAKAVKFHKGAIGRWRYAVQQFWHGRNIYVAPGSGEAVGGDESGQATFAPVVLHPNMPIVVLLLTPFAYMPVWLMALTFSLLKLAVLAPAVLAAERLAGDAGRPIPLWVAPVALLCGLGYFIADVQHGNTNIFVAAAVVGHLWLFRTGRNWSAGVMLALAVCLKMVPALFLLYWLYQRQWRVVGGLLAGLALFGVAIPAGVLGPERFLELTGTWWTSLIGPGLVGGSWFPDQINQSLPGMVARFFIGDGNQFGNYLWNPDDQLVATEHAWITLVALGPEGAKWLLRILQVTLVLVSARAIGWRLLPRDDARRGLHYSIVCALMLLLNQRSWDHHAGYLIVSYMALVYAIFRGQAPRGLRMTAGILVFATLGAQLLLSVDLVKLVAGQQSGADNVVAAYGKTFWHFLAIWLASVLLAGAMKKSPQPYQDEPAVVALAVEAGR